MRESRQLKKDDSQLIAFLYKKYYQQLYAFANAFLSDDEESRDVVNDTFASIWTNKSYQTHDEKSFTVYTYKLVRSRCMDILRHQKVEQRYQRLGAVTDIFHDDNDVRDFEEQIEQLRKAVQQLPEQGRKIIETCYYKKMTYQQTADELNISIHTVHKTMTKMYAKLRDMLKNHK